MHSTAIVIFTPLLLAVHYRYTMSIQALYVQCTPMTRSSKEHATTHTAIPLRLLFLFHCDVSLH